MPVIKVLVDAKLLIEINESWGDDCTLDQVKKQALDSASGLIDQAATAYMKHHNMKRLPITIYNPLKVKTIVFEEER